MQKLPLESLQQIFTEARTFRSWSQKDVSDSLLREIYDLMKMGPTSANCCPARIVFVKNGPQKEKLISCLDPYNVSKVQEAPVTAIVAFDEKFYDLIPKLAPHAPQFRDAFAADPQLAYSTAFRNSSLQGAYLILAARSLGLDCGPMSGFDAAKLDETFFSGTSWKSNFICNLGYGNREGLFPRLPRLTFEEACKIV